ncbi:DnaJ domain-containing protein [Thiocapsa rosea]|uniref:DnaJ-like protein n=1 Tax=Thiocapsa rosea TaxID=69360 RepID=A0A495V9D9_9GAMM|nr:DnaJ domain-containing protein [Thiocapsa rosea]RKT46022.1 DnaJ-like protein [Thiocapsa rosea]
MARLLILLGILGAVLWFLHWFRVTPAHRVSQVLRKAAFWGVIGVLVLAAATGRLSPIFAAVGAAIPLLLRAAAVVRLFPAIQQLLRGLGLGGLAGPAGAGGGARASSIRTKFFEMRLDHATGTMDGQILDGPFKDRRLSDLTLDELMRILEFYRDADAQSAAVLEAYLDREREADWRQSDLGDGRTGRAPAHSERLTKTEAWAILGLEPDADADAIRTAHRRLMQRLHPDRGGSDYLAAKINEAKRLLLGD